MKKTYFVQNVKVKKYKEEIELQGPHFFVGIQDPNNESIFHGNFYQLDGKEVIYGQVAKEDLTPVTIPAEREGQLFVAIVSYHSQKAYHDEHGFEVQHNGNKDSEAAAKVVASALKNYIDGSPNGSNPATGIFWSNRADEAVVGNSTKVWINYPIGD